MLTTSILNVSDWEGYFRRVFYKPSNIKLFGRTFIQFGYALNQYLFHHDILFRTANKIAIVWQGMNHSESSKKFIETLIAYLL